MLSSKCHNFFLFGPCWVWKSMLAKSFYFVCFQFFLELSVSHQFYLLFQKKLNFVYLKSHILVGNRDLLLFWEKKFFQKKTTKTGEWKNLTGTKNKRRRKTTNTLKCPTNKKVEETRLQKFLFLDFGSWRKKKGTSKGPQGFSNNTQIYFEDSFSPKTLNHSTKTSFTIHTHFVKFNFVASQNGNCQLLFFLVTNKLFSQWLCYFQQTFFFLFVGSFDFFFTSWKGKLLFLFEALDGCLRRSF